MLPCRPSPSKCTSVFKRHISRAASKHHVRMRALVSLYHQCDSFVTPENLSQKIDETFVSQTNTINLTSNFDKRSFAELRRLVVEREEEPRHFFGRGNKPPSTGLRVSLSSSSPNNDRQRTARAMEALVGMSQDGKPLWTAVQESAPEIEKQLKEDQRQGV
ncbi:hypothetical protein DEU56DRAFT_522086 [Suillus clintonianus]|uniref:uncharacterized protein n=1 Tax=Suillus clintonianus TaxID=1904413 RepID=UPI001B8769C9|nr:uncharacterized protein DEU56DRAFT_522086 [Suillus clintonianus]KAG2152937.1 hypothetical protein DEU56DRAFT_522086 [Suillus clintonianus]